MAKFWFVSAPMVSHTDWGGFLQTAHAIQQLGHEVIWVSTPVLESWIRRASLQFAAIADTGFLWPLPPAPDMSTIHPQEAVNLRYSRALDTWLTVEHVHEATRQLLALAEEIGKPDVIASDPFLSASALAAEALGVPLAICGWPAQADLNDAGLFPIQRDLGSDGRRRIDRLCEMLGLQGKNFSKGSTPTVQSPDLHICYFTRDWYGADAQMMLGQNLFVGGLPRDDEGDVPSWLADIPQNRPLGIVTLGTVFTGDLGFFSWAAHALAREGILPIVAIGWNPIEAASKQELVAALPKGTRLVNWVPFDQVLPRARLIIHHGGMGTTHRAIVHGVPQIVVPHAADQRIQAKRVAQSKIGLHLTAHDVRQGKLWEGVSALLKYEQTSDHAAALAQSMIALGGPARAAEAVAGLLPENEVMT